MASSAATSRLKSSAVSATKSACSSSSTKGALNRQIALCFAESSSNSVSADTPSHLCRTSPSLRWTFPKPSNGERGAYQVDSSYITHHFPAIDPLSKVRAAEMELLKNNGAAHPSPMKLLCLGGPGVGKGTYASLLSMRLGIPHISTGELIRNELSKPPSACSKTGELLLREAERTAMNRGKLIGDEVILRLLSNQLMHMDPNVGFILDGFPRTISQAHILDDAVGGVDMAINFHLNDDVLAAKCLGRRVCSECGKDYNLAHVDYCVDEVSDKGLIKRKRVYLPARLPPAECASKLKARGDDSNEAAVRERLRLFASESEPLEQHYRAQGKLVDLDVGPGVEYVWPRLLEEISEAEHDSYSLASYFPH